MERGIKISPNYHQKDWTDLNLDKNNLDDWNQAITIFKDRIDGRYFKQLEVLDNNRDRKVGTFSGFAIMSLTCLLIETLEQFWQGNITTQKQSKSKETFSLLKIFKRKPKKNEITGDSLAFHSFFQRSEILKVFFDTPEKSNVFYTKIRCGLLHQGQTKGKSLIHIRDSDQILQWINSSDINQGISLHRRKFLAEVKIIYDKFVEEVRLKDLNFKKATLKRKMDNIVALK